MSTLEQGQGGFFLLLPRKPRNSIRSSKHVAALLQVIHSLPLPLHCCIQTMEPYVCTMPAHLPTTALRTFHPVENLTFAIAVTANNHAWNQFFTERISTY